MAEKGGRIRRPSFRRGRIQSPITGALKNALDQAYKEWNRKPTAALAYGSFGGARALEHLRDIAFELQMAPVRSAVHLGSSEYFRVSPLGQKELVWWANATGTARAARLTVPSR